MKRMIATAALAAVVFVLPVMGSAHTRYAAPAYGQVCAAPAPVCQPVCRPACNTCFNPLGIVGDVFRGVGNVISGVGSIFGSTCNNSCY
jgi:hypothetical protein